MTKKRVHLVYSLVLSLALLVAGLCLIVACVGIYRSGEQPFSSQAVATAFSTIALPVYLCIALVIGGFILDGFWSLDVKKPPVEKQYGAILSRLRSKLSLDSCDAENRAAIIKEQKSRRLHKGIALGLLIVCSAVFLCYGLNPNNFHRSEINASMIRAMWVFIPCLALPFGYALFTAYFCKASMVREIAFLKAAGQTGTTASTVEKKCCKKGVSALRWGLLVVAVGIFIYGFV